MPWVEKNWGSQVLVKYLPKGFFVIIFVEKEERDKALNAKNWYFEKFPLYIQPWTSNFNPLKLVIYDSPVWIRLFNLPIEYWGDPCLEKIGRTLGTLLEIDEGIIDKDSYVYARMRIATKDSELVNPEREAILNPGITQLVEFPAANENEDCTVDSDTSNSEPEEDGDAIDILDPRCISQFANTLLGKNKGGKGRKSNRQIREEKANEKGLVSIRDFIKSSKGGSPSLGKI
ncbi:hypothetical protein SUGI_0882270 [Cryptomeria japonica]|nr:hypothetical protein SUGI_0882270 [Cryptomeria japonica]